MASVFMKIYKLEAFRLNNSIVNIIERKYEVADRIRAQNDERIIYEKEQKIKNATISCSNGKVNC